MKDCVYFFANYDLKPKIWNIKTTYLVFDDFIYDNNVENQIFIECRRI